MIEIARLRDPSGAYRVDSCTSLATIEDSVFDRVVSNYVLMDLPDLEGAAEAFHRVLVPGGVAVVVFSHPCFPQGSARVEEAQGGERTVTYRWSFPYFERRRQVDPPWGHFRADFIWFHRPLSDYWKAFIRAGFRVTDFEEPRAGGDRAFPAADEKHATNSRTRPYSVAFKLEKPSDAR
jgi:SAM-dependent methyltransferase